MAVTWFFKEKQLVETKSARVFAFAVLFAGTACLHAEERMRAGLWEVITTVDGKSASLGNTCYTAAMVEVANLPAKELRAATERLATRRGCTIKEFKMTGEELSMSKVCGPKSVVVTSTYSKDVFETVDTTTENGVAKIIKMKGRRIGECK